MKKLILCAVGLSIVLLLSSCGKNNDDNEKAYIQPPDIPDYSANITICDYKNITYSLKSDYTVTDEKLQSAVRDKLIAAAKFSRVEDRPAKEGDTVQVIYTGTIDGQAFDGGSSSDIGELIELGAHEYAPEFEDAIIGMTPGETKTVNVTFPESYRNETLRGKTAEFEVALLSIINIEYPEITDELVQTYTDYNTVDELTAAVKESLSESLNKAKENAIYDNIMSQIIDSSEYVSFPEDTINDLVNTAIASVELNADSANMPLEDYIKTATSYGTVDLLKADTLKSAESYMMVRMAICEIARRENITATPEEFTAYKTEFAANNGFDNIRDVNLYYKDADLLVDCIYDKVKTWLIETAKESE